MKVFTRNKYEYFGVQSFKGRCYYAFKNIQPGYSDEIILVAEAKLIYPQNLGYTYFHDCDLPDYFMRQGEEPNLIPETKPLLGVNQIPHYLRSLAENESKWAERRPASEVESLTSDKVVEAEGAARQGALTRTILNGIVCATETVRES